MQKRNFRRKTVDSRDYSLQPVLRRGNTIGTTSPPITKKEILSPAKPPFILSTKYVIIRSELMGSKSELIDGKRRKKPKKLSFTVGKGNNGAIVKRIMSLRDRWIETVKGKDNEVINFIWEPVSSSVDFSINEHHNLDNPRRNPFKGVAANHVEFHHEISSKFSLFRNMRMRFGSTIDEFVPPTFIFEFDSDKLAEDLKIFTSIFRENEKKRSSATFNLSEKDTPEGKAWLYSYVPPTATEEKESTEVSSQSPHSDKIDIEFIAERAKPQQNAVPKLREVPLPLQRTVVFPETLNAGKNLWLLKPDRCNRGKGVSLFTKLSQLGRLLNSYLNGFELDAMEKLHGAEVSKKPSKLVKPKKFVLQKYIERPLLIHKRKFDIRIYGMINHKSELFASEEGYIRMSGDDFSLDQDNVFVHLTNNAVQKLNSNYCRFEEGNIVPLRSLEEVFSPSMHANVKSKIYSIIWKTLAVLQDKGNKKKRQNCFEMFGFDFMIDEGENVWLIEVNTNPCIEEVNEFLKQLLPRVLDDYFKLTIDQIFAETESFENYSTTFSVDGVSDNQSIWRKLSS